MMLNPGGSSHATAPARPPCCSPPALQRQPRAEPAARAPSGTPEQRRSSPGAGRSLGPPWVRCAKATRKERGRGCSSAGLLAGSPSPVVTRGPRGRVAGTGPPVSRARLQTARLFNSVLFQANQEGSVFRGNEARLQPLLGGTSGERPRRARRAPGGRKLQGWRARRPGSLRVLPSWSCF